MTPPIALVSLADAEAWLGITSDNGGPVDTQTQNLINAVSTAVYGFIDRQVIAAQLVNEVRDGTGTNRMILHEWPVSSIQSLVLGNILIPPGVEPAPGASFDSPGFLFSPRLSVPPGQPCLVSLKGYSFWMGCQNVGVDYVAGYLISNEAWTVPATPFRVTVRQPGGRWATDMGVSYASSGVALTAVPGTPTVGQYALGPQGVYTFAAADTGRPMLISYGYVPAVLAQACLEGVQVYSSMQIRDPAIKTEKYGDISWTYNTIGLVGRLSPGSVLLTASITSAVQPYRSLTMAA